MFKYNPKQYSLSIKLSRKMLEDDPNWKLWQSKSKRKEVIPTMAGKKGTVRMRKPISADKAAMKLAVMLAPFTAADRKSIVKVAGKTLKLAARLGASS